MKTFLAVLRRLDRVRQEHGQGMVEYALIISVVSIGTIAGLTFMRDNIKDLFGKAGSSIAIASGGTPGVYNPSSPGTPGTPGSPGTPGPNGQGGTPPPPNTQVNSGNCTSGCGGLPPDATNGTSDDPIYNADPVNGPTGFTAANTVGIFWGQPGDVPPSTFPVTVTELGQNITVSGCHVTLTSPSAFEFYGVWIREPQQSNGTDWQFIVNGVAYEWACITSPAFTFVSGSAATASFTSLWTGAGNGNTVRGQQLSSTSGSDTNPWFDANTNNSNPAGVYDTAIPGGYTANANYFHPSNGTVWLCHWYPTATYNLGGNSLSNGCLATSPPPTVPTPGQVDMDCPGNGTDCDSNELITATPSNWNANNSPISSYRYEWAWRDSTGGNCTSGTWNTIAGATSATYQLSGNLPGTGDDDYRVRTWATNGVGESALLTGFAEDCTTVTEFLPPILSAAGGTNFSFSGTLNDNENVSFDPANTGGGSISSYTYQWQISATYSSGTSAASNCGNVATWANHPSTGPSTGGTISTTTASFPGNGSSNRCYRVIVTSATNPGGTWTGTSTSSSVYVDDN